MKSGQRDVVITFLNRVSALDESARLPFQRPYPAGVNIPETRLGAYLRSVEIVGPIDATGTGQSDSRRRIFTCSTKDDVCARKILSTLVRRAYRRPVTTADLEPLLSFYREGSKASFDAGIERALRRLLVSPEFLFRVERDPANTPARAVATFGVNVGGASKVEDLESLFKSNDLTVRVFRKFNLWPAVLPDGFDPTTGKMKFGWIDRLFRGEGPRSPGEWDAIRAAKTRLKVFVNRRSGTLSVSFESPSKDVSADIVRYYLDEGKNRLQEEALERAVRNKKFIEEQIGKTADALTRDRLYALYSQEVEQEMMARNRDQFGFRVVDPPRTPDRKTGPQRTSIAVTTAFFSFLGICVFFLFRGKGHGRLS